MDSGGLRRLVEGLEMTRWNGTLQGGTAMGQSHHRRLVVYSLQQTVLRRGIMVREQR